MRPWICSRCSLVNWPVRMDGTPRVTCHGCGTLRPLCLEHNGRHTAGTRRCHQQRIVEVLVDSMRSGV